MLVGVLEAVAVIVGVEVGTGVKVGMSVGALVDDAVAETAGVFVGVKVGVGVLLNGGWRTGPLGSRPMCSPFHDSKPSKYMVPAVCAERELSIPMKA